MKLITRNTDYAIRAIIFIAKSSQKVLSVSELVKELRIPRPFLRQILQVLNKKKILRSYKGKGGGFALSMPPKRIFLVDLLEIFQGKMKLNECFFKKISCPNKNTCALKKKIDRIEKYVLAELSSITIESLLN